MASITYDAQSFMLDGRRIWLVGGSVHYARIPREQWADRLATARQAGLNAIETPVIWARHEPRSGQFDFTGDNDLRHFVELVGQQGMWCILRIGPFVGTGWDLGGLPPWLLGVKDLKLRAASQPFLEASSRYITAVAQQVRDLQVSSAGAGGPIILVQNENAWTCGDDEAAAKYLGELSRYLREAGLTVPAVNANDLWQGVEGEIDTWTGYDNLLANLRQLNTVSPDKPRLVLGFRAGEWDVWGEPATRTKPPRAVVRRLAEVLAAGGQFNITPFCGGTNFDFCAGRDPERNGAFYTTSHDRAGPMSETGQPTDLYFATRRLCSFASSFQRLLASIDVRRSSVTIDPSSEESRTGGAISIAHAEGSQGSIAFIFGEDDTDGKTRRGKGRTVTLLLRSGDTLPVNMGNQSVAWCLFDTRLTARATLDCSNLSPFALVGKVLVLFGPAGTDAIVSINGSILGVEVPKGRTPSVIEHEGITVVIASEEQTDGIFTTDDAVYLGVGGLTRSGEPLPHPQTRQYTRVSATGTSTTHKAPNGGPKTPAKIHLEDGVCAPGDEYTAGTSPRYAAIDGPADLNDLGSPYGYGWYRIAFKSGATKKTGVLFDNSGDRLHLTLDGEAMGVVGVAPGASPEATLALKKRDHTLVVLAENLGRPSAGQELRAPKGVAGHLWLTTPVKAGKPTIETADPMSLLGVASPLWNIHSDDVTEPERPTWSFMHRRKTPIFFDISRAGPLCAVLLVNDEPVRVFNGLPPGPIRFDSEQLKRGKNVFQLAIANADGARRAEITSAVVFAEGATCLTEKADWAFARWETPPPDSFEKVSKRAMSGVNGPTWWRTSFQPDDSDRPLVLEATGLTKGQIYVNGRHVGRYFVATPDGKPVPPQVRYHIPRPWVSAGEPNELVVFDEHGGNPSRCKLAADATASPFG